MFLVFGVILQLVSLAVCQTVYLAGDSTMAKGGGGSGTDGWGVSLPQYLNIPVVNMAVGGESARSYTNNGRFNTLINSVKGGDFVIIEFGHNDAHANPDNGKQDAVGDGYDITATVTDAAGNQILIHSFAYYIENAINSIKAKGATAIISSVTPDNIWTGNTVGTGGRFVDYAQSIGRNESITYVNHNAYVGQAYDKLGQATVNTFYPNDHLHTSPAGAQVVAQAFVRGLLCTKTSTLIPHVNSAGQAVPSEFQHFLPKREHLISFSDHPDGCL
ncbi:rhamnogalacturonan acetylesterase [Dendrothele bispora CBS 962.96]|uniref:Rhamnogalacturonan acetylesterase n=1 Tax=Dendrothele bispora (strain CBS 962.96) TaxID=1314807 RepID=A0A4S8MW23_DENBC|nr:rhamnogalacturonan acetylesterase [Dendrothele bispora CBS 962.96]